MVAILILLMIQMVAIKIAFEPRIYRRMNKIMLSFTTGGKHIHHRKNIVIWKWK